MAGGVFSGSCVHIISSLIQIAQLESTVPQRQHIETLHYENKVYDRYKWLSESEQIRNLFSALPEVIRPSTQLIQRFIDLGGEIHWNETKGVELSDDLALHAFFIEDNRGIPILKLSRRSLFISSDNPFYLSELPGIIHELDHFDFLLSTMQKSQTLAEAWSEIRKNPLVFRDSERRALIKEHRSRVSLHRFLNRDISKAYHSLKLGRLLLSTGTYPEAEAMIVGFKILDSKSFSDEEVKDIKLGLLQMMKKSIRYERSLRKNALPLIKQGLQELIKKKEKEELSNVETQGLDFLSFYDWLFRQEPLALILSGIGGIGKFSRLDESQKIKMRALYEAASKELNRQ